MIRLIVVCVFALCCVLVFCIAPRSATEPYYTLRMFGDNGASIVERFIVGEEACKRRAHSWMRATHPYDLHWAYGCMPEGEPT